MCAVPNLMFKSRRISLLASLAIGSLLVIATTAVFWPRVRVSGYVARCAAVRWTGVTFPPLSSHWPLPSGWGPTGPKSSTCWRWATAVRDGSIDSIFTSSAPSS